MKLNKEKFMKTEMGGELEETIRTWDKAIDERRKATPGIGNPDQGLGFKYWDNTCRSCLDTTATCSLMMASRKTLSEHRENMAARTVCQNTVWMDNRF